jgi:hypothetical protein
MNPPVAFEKRLLIQLFRILGIGPSPAGGEGGFDLTMMGKESNMEEIDGIDVDLSLLPDDLQPLSPLIRKYAVGDDVGRGEIIEQSSTDDLRQLVATTEPRWDAINAYLEENMDPPGPKQDVATLWTASPRRPWKPRRC